MSELLGADKVETEYEWENHDFWNDRKVVGFTRGQIFELHFQIRAIFFKLLATEHIVGFLLVFLELGLAYHFHLEVHHRQADNQREKFKSVGLFLYVGPDHDLDYCKRSKKYENQGELDLLFEWAA